MNRPQPERGLPTPDAESAAHGLRVRAHIEKTIENAGGHISFEQYMSECLYAPGLGYYAAGSTKFGSDGDFVTAPEISPLFSRCLARQCAQILDDTDGDTILEFGAGSGVMAADMIDELAAIGRLPQRYLIIDPSPDLQAVQKQRLRQRGCDKFLEISWLSCLPATTFNGVIIANEVLDAMPVCRFALDKGVYLEEVVKVAQNPNEQQPFESDYVSIESEGLADAVNGIKATFDSEVEIYHSELNRTLAAWINSISDCIDRGVVLLIDYGYTRDEYYHAQRSSGTLMCHFRHRAHPDPYIYPGLQDITTHVDFTAVAEAGLAAGLTVAGYTTQAQFLIANGLTEFLQDSDPLDARAHLSQTAQVKKLTLPDEMGDRFKVIALCKNQHTPLHGFMLRDFTSRL